MILTGFLKPKTKSLIGHLNLVSWRMVSNVERAVNLFMHPVAVAEIVAGWGLDHEAVAAALLHDVVEDTTVTAAELEQNLVRS